MRKNSLNKFLLGLALLLVIVTAETQSPWGLVAYVLIVVYLIRFPRSPKLLITLAGVTSIAICAGYVLFSVPSDEPAELINRCLLLFSVWIAVYVNFRLATTSNRREQDSEQMRQVIAEKNRALDELKKVALDIENYKDERKSIENELLKGKRLHDAMVHNFPDGVICVLNKEMKYVLADGRGLAELGLNGAELKGELAAIGSGEELVRAFKGESVSFETSINHEPYTVKAVPIQDVNDDIKEILIVIRNITHRKRMENNLVRALEKEKELSLLKSQFVTMASHKFRTPLSTILSSVFLLENNLGADEQERKSYYDKIKRSVHNLTGLLNDFLSLGKLEEGKIKVAFSETDVKAFFDEFLQEIGLIKKGKQDIRFTFDAVSNTIMTDQLLLKNILMSLLSNAIEYSAYDSEIQLNVTLTKDNLNIRVSDQGIGIPKDEQHQIFKRFYRGQNTSNVEGTGLGLNIAKKYIRLLKGSIEFTSQVNKGTTFIANIPVVTLDILENQT
jgi:signal transduction histidine kinase